MTKTSVLYKSNLFGKIIWFIHRFGAKEMFLKPLRWFLAPIFIHILPKTTFDYQGRPLSLAYHRHNATWSNERAVEGPIAEEYLDRYAGKSILEIGHVTPYYFDVHHLIIDKYEKASNSIEVINQDFINFETDHIFDLILSISTVEHIGFDDDGDSREKIPLTISKCRSMLRPSGVFLMTVPLGYNPVLDELITTSELGCESVTYIRRDARRKWARCRKEDALRCEYGRPFAYANCIMVAEFNCA